MFTFSPELRAMSTYYTDVNVFPPLPDEGISHSSAGSQSSSASRQPRDRQQRGRSPRPSGQVHSVIPGGISSRSGNNLDVLRQGVATLRGQSHLLLLFRDVHGLLSVTSVLVHSLLDVATALLEPMSGRNLVPPTIMAIALRPWKLMC